MQYRCSCIHLLSLFYSRGGIYDLYCCQPPGGDHGTIASLFVSKTVHLHKESVVETLTFTALFSKWIIPDKLDFSGHIINYYCDGWMLCCISWVTVLYQIKDSVWWTFFKWNCHLRYVTRIVSVQRVKLMCTGLTLGLAVWVHGGI